jgi:ABC-type lipoprotein release transport system permease subunit
VLVRFAPGVDKRAAFAQLRGVISRKVRETGLEITRPDRPTDLVNFGRVQSMPLILAGVVGALAAAVLAHALVTAIRRRRRDLAILKTLGFQRSQVRRTVAWQASVFASVAVVAGLPTGIAAGRWLWTAFADQLGFVPAPRVPVVAIVGVIPATLLFANLIGMLPARSAARTQPALVLRTE